MTKIDFYITGSKNPEEHLAFACRLVEKAWRRKHDIFLLTADAPTSAAMDEMLWSFKPNSFLPHNIVGDTDGNRDTPAPSLEIGHDEECGDHHDVLIHLGHNTPARFSRFQRLAEIVAGDDKSLEKSRERYRFYKDRGYPLQVHNL